MDVKSFSLKGKVALILGGAGDIGKAIAETYSLAGADVVISSRKQEKLDKVMNVNVKGPFFLCKQIAPIMREQGGGSIINITSYMGIRTEETLGVYCISKAAVMHMTRVMAKEWGKWNIRVNSIAPAWVHSRLSAPFLQMPGVNDRRLRP